LKKTVRGFFLRKRWKKMKNFLKFQQVSFKLFSKLYLHILKNQGKAYKQLKMEEKKEKR